MRGLKLALQGSHALSGTCYVFEVSLGLHILFSYDIGQFPLGIRMDMSD